jgi:UDP-3-O-[3-hydroxymyristoyl] glucosamine N-acyltransferase
MSAGAAFAMTAAEIAEAVGGTLVGRGDTMARGVAPLDRATADDLSFLTATRYAPLFERSHAGVVIISPSLADWPSECSARVVVDNPHEALLSIIARFYRAPVRTAGVHSTAIIAPSARIGHDVCVEAYAVIGEDAVLGDRSWIGSHCSIGEAVSIGADTRLFPHVTLYPGTVVGDRSVLHSGVRVGSDGFGYVFRDGVHVKFPQVGRCIIGNDVEIGANSTLDRGSIDDTVVGDGTKIDNLVQVGHNVRIGRICLLMAGVGVAGSARLEDGVILAGQAGVGGHITIGAGARLGAQGGAIRDIPAGETWSGFPARPHRQQMKAYAAIHRLTALLKRIERLVERDGT